MSLTSYIFYSASVTTTAIFKGYWDNRIKYKFTYAVSTLCSLIFGVTFLLSEEFPLTFFVVKVCWELILIAFVRLNCFHFILERYFLDMESQVDTLFLSILFRHFIISYTVCDFLQDWLAWSPYCPRDSQEFLSSITIWKHQFFGAQPSWWSNSYLYVTNGKTIALTIRTLVGKVMSVF